VTNEALKKLADAGVTFVEANVPDLTRLAEAANFPIIYHDSVPSIVSYLREFGTGVTLEQLLALASESVRENLEARALPGGRLWVSDEDYAAARDVQAAISAARIWPTATSVVTSGQRAVGGTQPPSVPVTSKRWPCRWMGWLVMVRLPIRMRTRSPSLTGNVSMPGNTRLLIVLPYSSLDKHKPARGPRLH